MANWLGLSQDDVNAIAKSWQGISQDKQGYGAKLFVIFLSEHPEHIKYFPTFGIDYDTYDQNPAVKLHGLRVMNAIEALLGVITDKEKTLEILNSNAESHVKRKIKPSAYDDLRQSILKLVEGAAGKQESLLNAWDKALSASFKVITEHNP